MASHEKHVTYTTYLRVEELLGLQTPLSDGPEHDELLFITIHQVYELWFQQILHEATALQAALEAGETARALALMGRIRTIIKTCVAQVDILETMTPLQFGSFRSRLSSASGFQSAQFRELEAVMGRRDRAGDGAAAGSGMAMAEHLTPGSPARVRVEAAMSRRSLWDSALRFFAHRGHQIPQEVLDRDPSAPYEGSARVQEALVSMYRGDDAARAVAEALTDIDEGLGEWRYRHVMMVQRTIGHRFGTGGSSGVGYLRSTLFQPAFVDLWEMRSQL
jgi:tryptophan 2,3-dioxygenase